ncbi:MAG: hypothetical protein MN733_22870, partial [Nitrososphaera sp.]|nr:hypothetical protein [Nitrososphaera sp.]
MGPITGSIAFTYDNDFRRTAIVVNDIDTVRFAYDLDGLTTEAGDLLISRSQENGLVSGVTLDTTATSFTHDAFGDLATIATSLGGQEVLRLNYQRNSIGQITEMLQVIEGDTTIFHYTHDGIGQLIEVMVDSMTVATYTYDANGNRLSVTGVSGTITASYDEQDRLLSFGATNYLHTGNGERTLASFGSDSTKYGYDIVGNLKSVSLPIGPSIEYVLDGFGRRVGRKRNGVLIEGFLFKDRLNPVATVDSLGEMTRLFIFGAHENVPDYMVKGGVRYRLITDHLGSVRLVVDATSGAVIQRIDYDP